MYKLDIPRDQKEAAAIEGRRQRELQRQSRIFNAKVRTIGVDLQALEVQKRNQEIKNDIEIRRHNAFADDMIRNDRIAQLLEKRQQDDIRRLNKAQEEYRKLHQPLSGRREWDLYDPDGLKKDKPARVSDDDPRCTLSSLQKFDGEDLNSAARLKLQKEQMREWTRKQKEEKEKAEEKKRRAEHLYDLKQIELDQRALELQAAEEQCRTAITCAQSNYNKALADEFNHKQQLAKQREQDDNLTEIANNIYGDFLTENPKISTSAFGSHRVIPDRWKGFSPEQHAEVFNTQKKQEEENHRKKAEAEQIAKEWDAQMLANAKAGLILEREQERQRRELKKKLADANLILSEEQKNHQNFLKTEVYSNPPTAAYFMQFNTTSR